MRSAFASALLPLKGGTAATAEIVRFTESGTGGTGRTWTPATPAELVAVHYEALDAEGADALSIDLSGTVGRRYYFDGVLTTALRAGDRIVVDDITWTVERESERGNNSPTDSVAAVRRG